MAYKELERVTGYGTVTKLDGSAIGERQYRLRASPMMLAAGYGEMPATGQIGGFVEVRSSEGLDLVGQELVLSLKDGRSLRFVFINTDGMIAARGKLE